MPHYRKILITKNMFDNIGICQKGIFNKKIKCM